MRWWGLAVVVVVAVSAALVWWLARSAVVEASVDAAPARVALSAPNGKAPPVVPAPLRVDHATEAPAPVRFELGPVRVVRGLVVSKKSGTPLVGASVMLGLPGEATRSTTTDAHGQFVFSDVASVERQVSASAPGFATATLPLEDEVRFELRESGFVSGFVVDGQGAPVAGARVLANDATREHVDTTGPTGSFSLEVSPGTWALGARLGADVAVLGVPLSVMAGETRSGVVLTLRRGGSVEGVIREAGSQRPLVGAQLVFTPHDAAGELMRVSSDATGRYVAGPVVGAVDVVVRAAGYAEVTERGLLTRAGAVTRFDAELLAPGAIEGVVESKARAPLRGVTLRLDDVAEVAAVSSDGRGLFALARVPTGAHVLVAEREGFPATKTRVVVRAGQTTRVQLELDSQLERVEGVVLDVDGRPASRADVVARQRGDGAVQSTVADERGRFALSLTPASWLLNGSLPSKHGLAEVVVEPQQSPPAVAIRLKALSGGRRCVVVDEAGHAVPRATVSLSGGNVEVLRVADEEGVVELVLVPPTATLSIRAADRGRLGVLEWGPDAVGDCRIALASAGIVAVHLARSPSGRVAVSIPSGLSFREADTTLQFDGADAELPVPGGTHVLVFSGDGAQVRVPVTVSAGQRVTLELTLTAADAAP